MVELKFERCADCGTDASFTKAEDGTYYLWEDCDCGEFRPTREIWIVSADIPSKEIAGEESRTPSAIYGDEEPF